MASRVFVLEVPGEPVAQPRARHQAFGKDGQLLRSRKTGMPFVRVYTPDAKVKPWKERIATFAMRAGVRNLQHEGPVRVQVQAYFARRKSLEALTAPDGPVPHTDKPDKDNLEKAILDALKPTGLWRDDCQVYAGGVEKWYVARGYRPGAVITITLEEFPP